MVEVDLFPLFEGNLLHAAIVGIERNNRGPGQSLHELPCQLGFPGTGRTRNTDDVRSHYSDGGVISVYNPSTAATRPSTVKTLAWVATSTPSWRAVRVVMGPMEATGMPRSAPAPAASTRLRTVEELVKVRQSGRRARISRACSARWSGATVRYASTTSTRAPRRASSAGTRSRATAARGSRTRLPARSCAAKASRSPSATYSRPIRSHFTCNASTAARSEEHTSELQSLTNLV